MARAAVHHAIKASQIEPYYQQEVTNKIMKSGRKIFAILVLIDEPRLVANFIEVDLLQDQRLPFSTQLLRQHLEPSHACDFFEKQWEVLAPEFSRSTLSRVIQPQAALPFALDVRIGEGSFGTVFEIALDTDHQTLEHGFNSRIVRKELQSTLEHKTELTNLSILNHLKHPHILELLASYSYRDKHNLIFPLAEGGTLADLMKTDRSSTPFRNDETLLVALAGLSSAIEHVHNFSEKALDLSLIGCHHDIRPQNILVSKSKFLLSDFGLSRFKDYTENSSTAFKERLGDNLAPECEDFANGLASLHASRATDIWSSGCILAEIATYMALGSRGVRDFRSARRFQVGNWTFTYFHRGPNQANEAVYTWLSHLREKYEGVPEDFVNLINAMLSLDPNDRPNALNVTSELCRIALRKVATSIITLFERILLKHSRIDVLIEREKFGAWENSIGLGNKKCKQQSETQLAFQDFTLMLEHLYGLRIQLSDMINARSDVSRPGIRSVVYYMDKLTSFLTEDQLQSLSTYLYSTILGNNNSAHEYAQPSVGQPIDKKFKLLMSLKNMTALTLEGEMKGSGKGNLDARSVTLKDRVGQHHIGVYKGENKSHTVLVEWRLYGRQDASEEINRELYIRMEALANLLSLEIPPEFRSLQCRGFFHDTTRFAFGMVYDLPSPATSETPRPMTLKSVLEETRQMPLQPALEARFKLAYSLARSVLEFHMVGWLHKSLSSLTVLLFCNKDVTEAILDPKIIGFNHSRPDDPFSYTTGMPDTNAEDYQHPSYRSDIRRYQVQYDYYSLGVVLLEIGLWTSLSEMTKRWNDLSATAFRSKLLASRVPLLVQSMGTVYFDAVKVCIEGDFGIESDGKHDVQAPKELHLAFESLVIRRLRQVW